MIAAKRALDPERPVAEVIEEVAGNAVDLGDPGRDETYGWGLVRVSQACGAPPPGEISTRDG